MSAHDPNHIFEAFLRAGERARATHELAALGAAAVPVLESLFDGDARNAFGNAYAQIGALDGGYVTAKLLGPIARPLEQRLLQGAKDGHFYAVEALGALGSLSDESIAELARCIASLDFGGGDWNVTTEMCAALVRCRALDHPEVRNVASGDGRAARCLKHAIEFVSPSGP